MDDRSVLLCASRGAIFRPSTVKFVCFCIAVRAEALRPCCESTVFPCSTCVCTVLHGVRLVRPCPPSLTKMPRGRPMKRGRRPASARAPYKKLSSEEMRLARMWYTEDGMSADEIAGLLRRDRSTMTRLLVMGQAPQAVRTSCVFVFCIRVSVLSLGLPVVS